MRQVPLPAILLTCPLCCAVLCRSLQVDGNRQKDEVFDEVDSLLQSVLAKKQAALADEQA